MNKSETLRVIQKYCEKQLEEDVEFYTNIGLPLDVLWDAIVKFADNFEGRTELFFVLFKEMLRRGYLKLQRDGKIIEHTPEEWEAIFRAVWPKKVNGEWVNIGTIINFEEDDMGIWFISDTCPAYAVWVDPEDGSLEWAT